MITESLISTIITSGITGAGLIFASYSIIISFSDKIKKFKEDRISKLRSEIKGDKSTEELKKYIEEVETKETMPFYLSQAVYAIFLLYIFSVIFGLVYLYQDVKIEFWGEAAIWFFGIGTALFGLMGVSLLQDFLEFLRHTMGVKTKK